MAPADAAAGLLLMTIILLVISFLPDPALDCAADEDGEDVPH